MLLQGETVQIGKADSLKYAIRSISHRTEGSVYWQETESVCRSGPMFCGQDKSLPENS